MEKRKEYIKDICKLDHMELLRKIVFLSSIIFDVLFIIFLIVVIATQKKIYALGSFFSIILAVILVKITSRIPLEYVFELYSNSIRVSVRYEYTSKTLLYTTITNCRRKLTYQSFFDAKRVIKKNDRIYVNKHSKRRILSFGILGKTGRFYISPNDEFFHKLEGGYNNDIPR